MQKHWVVVKMPLTIFNWYRILLINQQCPPPKLNNIFYNIYIHNQCTAGYKVLGEQAITTPVLRPYLIFFGELKQSAVGLPCCVVFAVLPKRIV